jgi:hypothetical protein
MGLGAGILIFLPVLIKNYITSGYVFFPSGFTIGHPDWQVPIAMTDKFRDYIINVNRYYNSEIGFINSYPKTSFNWIPYWWNGILFQHKLLICLALPSLFVMLTNLNRTLIRNKSIVFFTGIGIMAIAWYCTAPDPRFAYGFLLIPAFLPFCLFIVGNLPKWFQQLILVAVCLVTVYYGSNKIRQTNNISTYLLKPQSPDQPAYKTYFAGKIPVNEPVKINANWNNRCYYIPLPCICEGNPYLESRGAFLKQGFRMKKITDSSFIDRFNF